MMADSDPVTYSARLGVPIVPDGKRDWGQHWRQQQAELEYRLAGVVVGNPNGQRHGYYTGQLCWDSQAGAMYACKTVGIPAAAEWVPVSDQGTVPTSRGGTGATNTIDAWQTLQVLGRFGGQTLGYRNEEPGVPRADTKLVVARSDGYGHASDSWDHMPVQVQNYNGGHAGYAYHNPGVNAAALLLRRDNGAPEWWDSNGRQLGAAIYKGMIFPFWGPINQIPPGYVICDGTQGTPNLVGKVIIGTAGGYLAPGTNLGAETTTTSPAGQHSHSGGTGLSGAHIHDGITQGTSLNIGHMPAHTHTYSPISQSVNTGAFLNDEGGLKINVGPTANTGSAGSGAPHAHGFNTNPTPDHNHAIFADGNHAHAVDVRQPSTALYYIMKQ